MLQIQYIYFRNLKGVFSYQNRLNLCLDGFELTDPVLDIAAEEVLSLCVVEPAVYCIPDPCSAYFENESHFTMVNANMRYLLLKYPDFDIRHGISVIFEILNIKFST